MEGNNEGFQQFLQFHEWQLKSSKLPPHFYQTLYNKLSTETFDAGNAFTLLRIDYDEGEKEPHDPAWKLMVIAEEGIKASDPQHVYLVDHTWTFKADEAKKQLLENEFLRTRLSNIMGIDNHTNIEEKAERIFNEMWRFCESYYYGQAENVEDRLSYWYIMDEIGSAITHSDCPNFHMIPFLYLPQRMTYSIIFPIKDIQNGDYITRNMIEKQISDATREAALIPWTNMSFLDKPFDHFIDSPEYFSQGHMHETLPDISQLSKRFPKKIVYKVFAEYSILREHLTDRQFEIVDAEDEADILWYSQHFTDFHKLSETPDKFVNQFPYEHVLTVKDLLAITCRRKLNTQTESLHESSPEWFPTCYNLREELAAFASYFQHRDKEGLDNYWIIKPYNLARGLDIHITNNINYIMRLTATGPKIAQKYIERPVLFYRPEIEGKVKFDIRYIVLLKSVKPLKVYAYKNFFLRFANKPFAMNNFHEYEQHFTVMNYKEDVQLKKMLCTDFIQAWAVQYPDNPWKDVEKSLYTMMREVFECATVKEPPCGIGDSPQSRTLFGFDVMLEWTPDRQVQAKLLEVNWIPDCKRACDYYPEFFNDIFKLLFLDEENPDVFEAV